MFWIPTIKVVLETLVIWDQLPTIGWLHSNLCLFCFQHCSLCSQKLGDQYQASKISYLLGLPGIWDPTLGRLVHKPWMLGGFFYQCTTSKVVWAKICSSGVQLGIGHCQLPWGKNFFLPQFFPSKNDNLSHFFRMDVTIVPPLPPHFRGRFCKDFDQAVRNLQ